MPWFFVLAQATATTGFPPLDLFLQYGVLGLIVIAFVCGWINPKPMLDRLIKENDELKADNKALRESLVTTVVPTLERATAALLESKRGDK